MFISIVTVVFNGGKTIERTILSVLKQEFKDYEFIIQDGGSKDNTLEIVRSYEDKFEGRLKLFSEKDKGIYDAMNKGIAHANGDYIWMVNADDFIAEKSLSDIYGVCKVMDFKPCVLSGCLNMIEADTLKIKYTSSPYTKEGYENNCKRLKMGISHPATIVHKNVYSEIGVYDDRYYISADVDFCLRCYREGVDVEFFDKVVTNMTDGGVSNQYPIMKNMHDCNLRTSKFCNGWLHRVRYTTWYFCRLIALKLLR